MTTTTHEHVVLATNLFRTLHAGQKYGDRNYFDYHLLGVANSVASVGYDTDHQIVALGHDALEDTTCSYEMLVEEFNPTIADAIVCISKHYYGREEYRDYLKRVASNPIATVVKYHDICFNMLNCVIDGNVGRQKRYVSHMQQLQEFAARCRGG